jgi:hypothetical protein
LKTAMESRFPLYLDGTRPTLGRARRRDPPRHRLVGRDRCGPAPAPGTAAAGRRCDPPPPRPRPPPGASALKHTAPSCNRPTYIVQFGALTPPPRPHPGTLPAAGPAGAETL